MLQFLDKSTLGYAAIFGLIEDTVRLLSSNCSQDTSLILAPRTFMEPSIHGWVVYSTLVTNPETVACCLCTDIAGYMITQPFAAHLLQKFAAAKCLAASVYVLSIDTLVSQD